MSQQPQGPGWWVASDGRYYPPESHPSRAASVPPQMPPPQKKSRVGWWLLGAFALIVVSFGACGACVAVVGSDSDDTSADVASEPNPPEEESDGSNAEAEEPEAEEPESPDGDSEPNADEPAEAEGESVAAIGEPARDGKFEFVVESVDTGRQSVGDGFLEEQAQGAFTVVTVTATNIGDEPRTFTFGNQSGFDSQGRQIDANTSASIAITMAGSLKTSTPATPSLSTWSTTSHRTSS